MANRPSLDDYVDVAERIVAFNEKYPDGTLETIDWTVTEVGGKTFVVYRAAAYRTMDDRRPGHGTAWEPFPGPTPYTKDSELMNAETAAWGRAIVACGLPANRKIASRQEVAARHGNAPAPTPAQGVEADPDLKAQTGPSLKKIFGDDIDRARETYAKITSDLGAGYMPAAAARALVIVADALEEPPWVGELPAEEEIAR